MGTIIGSGGQKIKTQRKVMVSLLCIILHLHMHIVLFVGIKCCYKGTSRTPIGFVIKSIFVKIFSDSLPGSNERSISVTGGKAAILSVVNYVLTELGEVMVYWM